MKTLIFVLLTLVAFGSASCRREISFEGLTVNQFADKGRTNSYESTDDFLRTTFFIDSYPEIPDKSGAIGSPLLLSSVKMVIPNAGGALVCIDNHSFAWIARLDSNDVVSAGMVADPQQNIYVIGLNGSIYSFSKDGNRRWKKIFCDSIKKYTIFSDILCLSDGIIAASSDGIVAKFSFDGALLWENRYELSPLQTFSATESDKIIIPLTHNEFGRSDTILCIDRNGKELWKTGLSASRLIKNPVVYKNIIVQPALERIGSNNFNLCYALDTLGNVVKRIEMSITPRYTSIACNGDIYIAGYNVGLGQELSGVFCYGKDFKLKWHLFFEAAIGSPLIIGKERIAFFGQQKEASGVYFLRKDGNYESVFNLSEAPIPVLPPVYNPDGSIIFACKDAMTIIRIDDTDFSKMIPW